MIFFILSKKYGLMVKSMFVLIIGDSNKWRFSKDQFKPYPADSQLF